MQELLEIVQKTIEYFFKNNKIPTDNDIQVRNKALLTQKACVFVTIYKSWVVRWSAWNVKELESNIINETIKSTIDAIANDNRFNPLSQDELKDIKIRVDYIKKRDLLSNWKILNLDPQKSGLIVICKDYSALAVILPWISKKLLRWEDFIPIIEEKIKKIFKENDNYIYEIKTDVFTNLN